MKTWGVFGQENIDKKYNSLLNFAISLNLRKGDSYYICLDKKWGLAFSEICMMKKINYSLILPYKNFYSSWDERERVEKVIHHASSVTNYFSKTINKQNQINLYYITNNYLIELLDQFIVLWDEVTEGPTQQGVLTCEVLKKPYLNCFCKISKIDVDL